MKIEITTEYRKIEATKEEKELMWVNYMTDVITIFDLDEFMFGSCGEGTFKGENKIVNLCASQRREGYITIVCNLNHEEHKNIFTETIRNYIAKYNYYYPNRAKIISGLNVNQIVKSVV